MPDWFVLAVFISLYVVLCIGMLITILTIMDWAGDIAWKLLRKIVPSLPENRKEYYERTSRQLKDAHTKLGWLSNKDKH